MKALLIALLGLALLAGLGLWLRPAPSQDPLVGQLRQEADQLKSLTEEWRKQLKGK